MPGTIVCGVDSSDAAEAVAETARWLANGLKSHLVLVHATEEPAAKADEVLTSVRVRLSLGGRDDVRLAEGAPAARLMDCVDEEGAELLVVGSRGR